MLTKRSKLEVQIGILIAISSGADDLEKLSDRMEMQDDQVLSNISRLLDAGLISKKYFKKSETLRLTRKGLSVISSYLKVARKIAGINEGI